MRRGGTWLGLGAALLLLAVPAHADFKRDYGAGKRSYLSGDYRDAIDDLQAAIDENPRAEAQVRIYGMRFEPYLPHYYLGAAKFKLGDCAGALQAWQEADRQGLIRQMPEYTDMQRDMAVCQSQVVDVTAIAQAAREAIDELEQGIARYAALGEEALLREEWRSRFEPDLAQARTLAAALRSQLAAAVEATAADQIEDLTRQAREGLVAVNGSVDLAGARLQALREAQASQLAEQREQARRELRQAIAAARGLQAVDGGSQQMNSIYGDLASQLQRAEGISDSASSANLRELAQALNNTLRRYQQAEQDWRARQRSIAERTPPPRLKQVAEAYFSGDYDATTRLADPDQLGSDREKVQALLFRAAASYKLYVLSGEQQQAQLSRAQADIRAIKRLNRNFSPYLAAFSPGFIELFQRTS